MIHRDVEGQVDEELIRISLYDLQGALSGTVQFVQGLPEGYPDHHSFRLEIDYQSYMDDNKLVLMGLRPHTAKEVAQLKRRRETAKRRKEREKVAKEEREVKLYEILRKKYE